MTSNAHTTGHSSAITNAVTLLGYRVHRIFLAAIFLIATPSIAVAERIAITLGQAINAADLIASGEIPEISTIENRVIESMGKPDN